MDKTQTPSRKPVERDSVRKQGAEAGDDQRSGWPPRWTTLLWYLVILLALQWFWQDATGKLGVRTIPYSEFKSLVAGRRIVSAKVTESEITGEAREQAPDPTAPPLEKTDQPAPPVEKPGTAPAADAKSGTNPGTFAFRTVRVEDPELVRELQDAGVNFSGERPSLLSQFLWAWVVPLGLMLLLWRWLAGRMAGMGKGIMSFGASKAKLVADRDTGVTFADVAGCDEAKFELEEVVNFLKKPDRYRALGAKIPKGVLLVGPPGTGKTLLARAVAGEAEVPFFSISGSEFIEMFVGVGAARVRDLFEKAKSQAPCIVFIDELDSIGQQRGVRMGMVNDEREQTLNQMLAGMDGFDANVGVVVLAATNRPEVLDRALLRPGRFDRQIVVDTPDIEGRLAILKLHQRGKPVTSDADLRKIAQETPGFSGADLANLMNEAALLAARRDAKEISQGDLQEAFEKVVAGPERRSRRLSEKDKKVVAVHEVGHALVATFSGHADAVHKISIVPRGRAALGYTLQLPEDDQYLRSRAELVDKITGLLGGRAAEEVVFSEITTGAENDLEHATALARQMVCVFGMGKSVGLVHCAAKRPQFLPDLVAEGAWQRDCSEETAREIDEEVKKSSMTHSPRRRRFCRNTAPNWTGPRANCWKKRRSTPMRSRACSSRKSRGNDRWSQARGLQPPRHGKRPRSFFASNTRWIPRLSAANRIERDFLRLRFSVCVKAPSRMRKSLSATSVSVQKKRWRSCTHSK
jgi:cell division protease FtsH